MQPQSHPRHDCCRSSTRFVLTPSVTHAITYGRLATQDGTTGTSSGGVITNSMYDFFENPNAGAMPNPDALSFLDGLGIPYKVLFWTTSRVENMGWYLTLLIEQGVIDVISLSYGDTHEATVLERLFPKRHWVIENPDAKDSPPEFDFIGNSKLAGEIISDYRKQAKAFNGNLGQAPMPCFGEEFLKTYNVGRRLQEMGLHPRVSIG